MFEKDLNKAEYGDGPLAYSDQITPEMIAEHEKAKIGHAFEKLRVIIQRKPTIAIGKNSVEKRVAAWEKRNATAREWFAQSGMTPEDAYSIYLDGTKKMKDRKIRDWNYFRLKKRLSER